MTLYCQNIHESYKNYFEVVYTLNIINVHLYKSIKLTNIDTVLLDICLFEKYKAKKFKNILKSNIRISENPDDEGKIYENNIKELKISLVNEIEDNIYLIKFQIIFYEQLPLKLFIELNIGDEFKPLKILNDKLIIKSFNIIFMEYTGQEIRQFRSQLKN